MPLRKYLFVTGKKRALFCPLFLLFAWITGCGDPNSSVANTQAEPTDSRPSYHKPAPSQPVTTWRFQQFNGPDEDNDVTNDYSANNSESSGPFIHLQGKTPPAQAALVARNRNDYRWHHVRGDGSCEVRARTLRLVVYFAIEYPERFNRFMSRLHDTAVRYEQQDTRFAKLAKWQEALFLIKQLQGQSLKEIIHAFNSEHFEEIVIERFIRPFWAASIREGIMQRLTEQIDDLMKTSNSLQEQQISQHLIQMKQAAIAAKTLIINNKNNAAQLDADLTSAENDIRIAYDTKRTTPIDPRFEKWIRDRREARSFQLAQFKSSRQVEKAKNWGFKALVLYAFFESIFGLPTPEHATDGLVIPFSHPQEKHMDVLIKRDAL